MREKQVTVIARMRAKKGMEEELRMELLALVEPSRADEGCINYDLHQATADPSLFVFYENWQNAELLKKHSVSAHLRAFRLKADELLAEPSELLLLDMIS